MVTRIAGGALLFAVGTGLVVGVCRSLRRELRQTRAVAQAAQRVLLRPLPSRLGGLSVAGTQLPALPGAVVGGDLYEAVATPYGVRVIIGDVRGHGLAALGAVAAVLGSFREAAYEEPGLGGLLRRLDRALQRYVGERTRDEGAGHPASGSPPAEEFVTVLLLDIHHNGDVLVLNCGHPWPYRIGAAAEPLAAGEPLPPLGAFPLPDTLPVRRCDRLLPGEALFLHTDGAGEARDAAGRFFPLEEVLGRIARRAPRTPAAVIEDVRAALLAHTGGRLADDVSFVVVRDDRVPAERVLVPARTGEPGPHRTRPAPSSR
ncbi:PP2C family protein-serine/threonine phosphatase [Streptomyces sp. TRM76323]|uniref:PP2C family protein-serine/threonine phosphatase n=2 Tax=Streptomyces tamarix TaxID=3078565 RepID=A0ABU3QN03_9ACTN|nr:PP2C family protein-serine/threonine phosphatase [Streptomyces tamarix]MDT9684145.1 PP2C family protein-serine/threonine phosphatase [Streptomyces tamarix]